MHFTATCASEYEVFPAFTPPSALSLYPPQSVYLGCRHGTFPLLSVSFKPGSSVSTPMQNTKFRYELVYSPALVRTQNQAFDTVQVKVNESQGEYPNIHLSSTWNDKNRRCHVFIVFYCPPVKTFGIDTCDVRTCCVFQKDVLANQQAVTFV